MTSTRLTEILPDLINNYAAMAQKENFEQIIKYYYYYNIHLQEPLIPL
jgi:hypothetical protein